MGLAQTKTQFYTFEEYLDLERLNVLKHEYYQGEVFAMAGGTLNHNRIITNSVLALKQKIKLKGKGCDVFNSDVKLEFIKNEYYVYPDVMMTCHPIDLKANLIVKYPSIAIEVLSKSTESYDRGMKMRHYLKLASLEYYVLIDQHQLLAEIYERNEEGDWIYKTYENVTDSIHIKALDGDLSLSEIYEGIEFTDTEE